MYELSKLRSLIRSLLSRRTPQTPEETAGVQADSDASALQTFTEIDKTLYKVGETIRHVETAATAIEMAGDDIAQHAITNGERAAAVTEQIQIASSEIRTVLGKSQVIDEQLNMVLQALSVREQLSAETVERIATSVSQIQKLIDDIRQIDNLAEASASKAAAFREQVHQIKRFSEVIQQIASQTHLLSLNAAIEAAHAGEAGRTFAVVAKAVRELSEETKNTVEEMTSFLEQIVDASNDMLLMFADQRREIQHSFNHSMQVSAAIQMFSEDSRKLIEQDEQIRSSSDHVRQEYQLLVSLVEQLDLLTYTVSEQAESSRLASEMQTNSVWELQSSLMVLQNVASSLHDHLLQVGIDSKQASWKRPYEAYSSR